jgi:hypothetical protein
LTERLFPVKRLVDSILWRQFLPLFLLRLQEDSLDGNGQRESIFQVRIDDE